MTRKQDDDELALSRSNERAFRRGYSHGVHFATLAATSGHGKKALLAWAAAVLDWRNEFAVTPTPPWDSWDRPPQLAPKPKKVKKGVAP